MTDRAPRGLICDYGGVLTTSVARAFRRFEEDEGLPKGTVFEIIGEAYAEADGTSPIVRFETGDVDPRGFAEAMADHLRQRGHEVAPDGLATRMFAGTDRHPEMWDVVRRLRSHGIRTALLSNSWGVDGYPVEELGALFDALVISGEVGLRKPDPDIYRLAAERIDLAPARCVFIDDLERNVQAAREVGMTGIHHRDLDDTVAQLEAAFGLELTAG